MFSIPSYLLERIFVKDSLKNTEEGFEFTMKNVVDSGTLTRLMAVELDGQALPLDQITVVAGQKARPATEITPSAPLHFPVGSTMTVKVAGRRIEAGEHQLNVRVNTWEAGVVSIPIKVTVS
ncbi:MAG: DUF6379 domain-containing protein [Anaerolineae bacterium]|nr:DUF6379 domain-containing protein [Anaerolineae bacterium]MDW8100740.1 DUF6379 domain-containing protein [Anaerolineae bacterium]